MGWLTLTDQEAARVAALTRTTRHLTGHETFRLLNRRDLPSSIAAVLWTAEGEEQGYLDEIAGEQLAETGRCTRHYTPLVAYLNAHPVHGPVEAPANPFGALDGDDVPF